MNLTPRRAKQILANAPGINKISSVRPQEMKVARAQPGRNSHLDWAAWQAGTEMLIHMSTAGQTKINRSKTISRRIQWWKKNPLKAWIMKLVGPNKVHSTGGLRENSLPGPANTVYRSHRQLQWVGSRKEGETADSQLVSNNGFGHSHKMPV